MITLFALSFLFHLDEALLLRAHTVSFTISFAWLLFETSALIFTVTYRSVRVDLRDSKSLGSVALDKELDANDMNGMLYAIKGRGGIDLV